MVGVETYSCGFRLTEETNERM